MDTPRQTVPQLIDHYNTRSNTVDLTPGQHARSRNKDIYDCDYQCGFAHSSYERVELHEKTECKLRPVWFPNTSHRVKAVTETPEEKPLKFADFFDMFKHFSRDLTPAELTGAVSRLTDSGDSLKRNSPDPRVGVFLLT